MKRDPHRPRTGQQLWRCGWGTMSALVWARTAHAAEAKVRAQRLAAAVTKTELRDAPVIIKGDVVVRPASARDVAAWAEQGGKLPRSFTLAPPEMPARRQARMTTA